MKITIDHNCLLDMESNTEEGRAALQLINSRHHECFIVNIGASELRRRGIRPDTYQFFEDFVRKLGLGGLKRLSPMAIIDVTFIDYGIIASDEMVQLSDEIESILFPNRITNDTIIETLPYKPIGRKKLNQLCDVHTMWCHIHYGNQAFLTSDKNFHKSSKKSRLAALGAGMIKKPSQMLAWSEKHLHTTRADDEFDHNEAIQPTS